jgi:hypothetical protein
MFEPSKKPPKVVETVGELLELLGFHREETGCGTG